MWFLHSLFVLILLWTLVYGQNFTVPSAWRKPTSSIDQDARYNILSGAIDSLIPSFNESSGQIDALEYTQNANLLCAIAQKDWITSSNEHQSDVVRHIDTVFNLNPNISSTLNTDPINWGLAAAYGYRAYQDTGLLNLAVSIWEEINKYMIYPEDAVRGRHATKNVTIPETCNGASIAGGVFYIRHMTENTDVNGATVGGFLALSAHLWEGTNEPRYANAALLSSQFIQSQLYNGTIILDTITVANCYRNPTLSVTYNSGFTIEGLSIFSNLTSNATWTGFLHDLVSTTAVFPHWTESDGIIIEGASAAEDAYTNGFGQALKGIYVRGLYEAWSRAKPNGPFANYVQSFLTVQFNALQDLARTPNTNIYSPRWQGPNVNQTLPWGQLAALDVLNAAAGMATTPKSAGTSTTQITQPSMTAVSDSKPKSTNHTPVIAGVTVGVGGFLLLISLAIFFLFRRHRKQKEDRERAMLEEPTPFGMDQYTQYPPYETYQPNMSQIPLSASGDIPSSIGKGGMTVLSYAPEGSTARPSISNSIANGSGTARAGPSTSPLVPGVQTDETLDLAAVPVLLEQLNQIMAKLPPGGVDEEHPPRYEG